MQKNLSGMLIDKITEQYPDIIMSPEEAEFRFGENSLLIIVDTHLLIL